MKKRSVSSSRWIRVARMVVLALVLGYVLYTRWQNPPLPEPPAADRADRHGRVERAPPADRLRTVVEDMTIRDEEGDVVWHGDIDLAETLSRIDRRQRIPNFPNDGDRFENRERRLPRQTDDYYREWVHPTPRLPGPGPQRVVSGRQGDRWYTPDHYRSFIPLHRKSGAE